MKMHLFCRTYSQGIYIYIYIALHGDADPYCVIFALLGNRICSSATKEAYEVMDVGILNPAEHSTNHL